MEHLHYPTYLLRSNPSLITPSLSIRSPFLINANINACLGGGLYDVKLLAAS
jgi:hypothetical protein